MVMMRRMMRIIVIILTKNLVSKSQECAWSVVGEESKYTGALALEAKILSPDVYDKSERPSVAEYNELDAPADLVTVQIELTSFAVNEIDLTVNPRGLLRYRWQDKRLQYESPSAENCSGYAPEWILSDDARNSIWRPDLYFENLREVEFSDDSESAGTWIYPDGSVFDSRFLNTIFDCPIKVKRIPLDRHTCKIRIGAYSLNDQSLELKAHHTFPLDARKTLDNAIWALKETRGVDIKINFGQVGDFDFVDLEMDIRRRLGYHLLYSMGPGVLFLLVGYCGFFMDRHLAPARVTIAIIPVLIMRLLLNGIFARLETVSYAIYLSQFLIICMYLSCFCVFEYALVSVFLQCEHVAQHRRKSLKSLGDRVVRAAISRLEQKVQKVHTMQQKQKEETDTPPPIIARQISHPSKHLDSLEQTTTEFEQFEADIRTKREFISHGDGSIELRPGESIHSINALNSIRNSNKKARALQRLGSGQRHQSWYHVVEHDTEDSDTDNDDDPSNSTYFHSDYNPALERDLDLLRKNFKKYDTDNSKTISPIEVSWVLRNYGVYINSITAHLEIKNWRYLNGFRIPKDKKKICLNFHQFADFLMGYEKYSIGDYNDTFRFMPVSLKIDILCRLLYIPCCVLIFFLHYYGWFLCQTC